MHTRPNQGIGTAQPAPGSQPERDELILPVRHNWADYEPQGVCCRCGAPATGAVNEVIRLPAVNWPVYALFGLFLEFLEERVTIAFPVCNAHRTRYALLGNRYVLDTHYMTKLIILFLLAPGEFGATIAFLGGEFLIGILLLSVVWLATWGLVSLAQHRLISVRAGACGSQVILRNAARSLHSRPLRRLRLVLAAIFFALVVLVLVIECI